MNKVDIVRELSVIRWKLEQAETEIWIGKSIAEFPEKRIDYINALVGNSVEKVNDIINDLKKQKENEDAR
jgi:hypothetical protein